jgi:hypothetical protein
MAFKLTYSDGQSTDYDDSTNWEVENGVVKLGRESGEWTVLISPSHWATLELETGEGKGGNDKKKKDEDETDKKDKSDDKDDDKDD